jgi:transporter family-2 protein
VIPSFWPALAAILGGGALLATQAPINARLARAAGDPVLAATISFAVGFAALGAAAALRGVAPDAARLAAAPWWVWTGGLLGACFVLASVWTAPALGVLTLTAAVVMGQLLAALALDAVGAFGLPVQPVGWRRLAAVALVGAGLALSRG